MARTKLEDAVETDRTAQDADATAAAPGALETAGEGSSASDDLSEVVAAAEETIAEVREELSEVGQAVLEWCNEHFYNSPISRATEALNYLREHAVPDLIQRIERI